MADKNHPPIGPDHSRDREFTAVLEDLRGQFRVFGEGLTDVREKVTDLREKVSDISERLERVEQDVIVIKMAVPNLAQRVTVLEKSLR